MVHLRGVPIQPTRSAATSKLTGEGGSSAGTCPLTGRNKNITMISGKVLCDWLASFPRRWGDGLFARNDDEASWWGWQITKTRGGLGRRYRDPRFDTLAACARCAGAGVAADAPCEPCLGTGRITLGEAS